MAQKQLTVNFTPEQKAQIEKFLGKKIKGTTSIVRREDLKISDKALLASLVQLNSKLGSSCCW